MSHFLSSSEFKRRDPKEFDSNKYSSHSSKVCVLEFHFKCSKKLCGSRNGYPLAADKIEIEQHILSNYQLNITDFYNILIGTVKKIGA